VIVRWSGGKSEKKFVKSENYTRFRIAQVLGKSRRSNTSLLEVSKALGTDGTINASDPDV
jgi:hypothetical protein